MISGAKKDSRVKKKAKLVFAKDKKQASIALAVLAIFLLNSSYMGIKYFIEQNASTNPSTTSLPPQTPNNGGENMPNPDLAQDANDIYSQTLNTQEPSSNGNLTTIQDTEDEVDIMSKKRSVTKNQKMVVVAVSSSGRSNPFLPAGENMLPSSLTYLPPPPETLLENSEAGKVMSTTISGILYDKYSPSAIINIEGTDYLVKRGDVINNYKILSIEKTQVMVQLGQNVYKAGVGELLSQADLSQNNIANLNKKFGGNTVSINVKKKGY